MLVIHEEVDRAIAYATAIFSRQQQPLMLDYRLKDFPAFSPMMAIQYRSTLIKVTSLNYSD
ncbi:hypothetical protein H6F77_06290 [Microcoleus sp. FACHB-831]|uniref:hypothetical protein n=1 Tax=Microcoleus sp. FACHB-831 TaxID=2692827 RepID=UPI00168309E4|nr:hypothetical protein [Microcoleus sp. FACHB-831]MBD1920692.1 hypothetical protein [Microcoleus sp. FACHB-831]